MRIQWVTGLGCALLSISALAAPQTEGGLEGIIDQMEQHGISHDMQLNDTIDALTPDDSGSDAATATNATGQAPANAGQNASQSNGQPTTATAPVAGNASPARVSSSTAPPAKQHGSIATAAVAAAHYVKAQLVGAGSSGEGARTGGKDSATGQVAMAKPRMPRHNPLADIPPAAGGLEQIINIQELNASLPFRPAVVDGQPVPSPLQPGATGDRGLGEAFMK
jgi:hypothetical protein